MKKSMVGIGAAFVLVCGMAGAQTFEIVPGKATVDGVLSPGEWDKANWITMDKVLFGNPTDLSDASWAAMWDSSENVIYVAVTGTDTNHVMHIFGDWDGQDDVEIYINARNDDTEAYGTEERKFDYAQQYIVGYSPVGPLTWAVIGANKLSMPTNMLPAAAFGMVTNRLVYELKLRPYDYFNYDNVSSSTEITLREKLVIGLDAVMASRTSTGDYGWLAANMNPSKFNYAGRLQDHKLVGRPYTYFYIR
jgi:hypothetical protein